MDKTKSRKKLQSFEVIELVLIQCNSADNQYWQKSDVLYTFTLDKSNGYL